MVRAGFMREREREREREGEINCTNGYWDGGTNIVIQLGEKIRLLTGCVSQKQYPQQPKKSTTTRKNLQRQILDLKKMSFSCIKHKCHRLKLKIIFFIDTFTTQHYSKTSWRCLLYVFIFFNGPQVFFYLTSQLLTVR